MCNCHGIGIIKVHINTGNSADVGALTVHERPLDFDLLLGYDAMKALVDVLIRQMRMVEFCEEAPMCAALKIDQPVFSIEFDQQQKVWTASWKWSGDREPVQLQNSVAQYHVPSQTRPTYETELCAGINDGRLIPYPHEKIGPPKGLIPLMPIVQEKKAKVRPGMDNWKLNQYVNTSTADADVCASKQKVAPEWI